jgi:hypothetical protein
MSFILQPCHVLLAAICGIVNSRSANFRMLKSKCCSKKRQRLTVKAHAIGCKALRELTTIGTPETVLR